MALDKSVLLGFLDEKFGIDVENLAADEPLFSSGMLDSFSMIDVLLLVETNVGKRINPADISLENLDTVDRILSFADQVAKG
jgi:acyl carrier protein